MCAASTENVKICMRKLLFKGLKAKKSQYSEYLYSIYFSIHGLAESNLIY